MRTKAKLGWIVTVMGIAGVVVGLRAATTVDVAPETRIRAESPEWRELAARFARQPDGVATFEERRHFPFRKAAVAVNGVARVSRERGLSLHYSAPEERVVILDEQGVLVRDAQGRPLPSDARAEAAQRALLHALRLDLAALEKDFELHGRRDGAHWSLALVPKAESMRRSVGNVFVAGEGVEVRTIELRRSARQRIEIALTVTQAPAKFSDEDVRRFFR